MPRAAWYVVALAIGGCDLVYLDDVERDPDGDGVASKADNCPDVANADQDDEDGDEVGDACDLCPPYAGDDELDTDKDGVGDRCDPHPDAAGDEIVLFEGFARGIPNDWTANGPWSSDGGDAVIMPPMFTRTSLRAPIESPRSETLSAGITIIPEDNDFDWRIGVIDPLAANIGGEACVVAHRYQTPQTETIVGLYDPIMANLNPQAALGRDSIEPVVVELDRSRTMLRCRATMTSASSQVERLNVGTATDLGLFVFASDTIEARFAWVMVVASPP